MDHDDPIDWSIDRVIDELCHNQSPSWAVGVNIKLVTNPDAVEKALRENDIDGDNLLALEDDNLRFDLGIVSFGQRRGLKNIIDWLRAMSLKYQARIQVHISTSTSTSLQPTVTPQLSTHPFSSIQPSSNYLDLDVRPSIEQTEFHNSARPVGNPNSMENDLFVHSGSVTDQAFETNIPAAANNIDKDRLTISSKQSLGKRKKTTKRAVLIPVQGQNSMTSNSDTLQFQKSDVDMTGPGQGRPIFRHSSHESDNDDGPYPKRLKIVQGAYVPHKPFSGVRSLTDAVVQKKSADAVDDVLPQEAEVDELTGLEFNFVIVAADAESYRRSRMSRRSRHLVHAALSKLSTEGTNDDIATAEHLGLISHSHGHDIPSSRYIWDDLDADHQFLLRKYPPAEDDAFPLYGDSDEEDRMMTPEWETSSEGGRQEDTNALTKHEIDLIVDRTFEKFRDLWRQRYLLKFQVKAYKKWMIAAKNKALHGRMLLECQNWQSRTQKRIVDHRNGIYCSVWRKAEDVEQQCLAIEVSIHQLEEYNLYVSVLENELEPPRPVQTLSNRPRGSRRQTVYSNGEEDLESDSDEFDLFVVDEGKDSTILDVDLMSLDQDMPTWNPKFSNQRDVEHQEHSISRDSPDHGGRDITVDPDDYPVETVGGTAGENASTSSTRHIELVSIDSDYDSPSEQRRTKLKKKALEGAQRNPLYMPCSMNSSDIDSDFERRPRLPPTKFRRVGKSAEKAIDLTRSSSISEDNTSMVSGFNVHTPKLGIANIFELSTRPRRSKQSSTSSKPSQKARLDDPIFDVLRMRSTSWLDIESATDGRQALAKCIYESSAHNNHRLNDFVRSLQTEDDFGEILQAGMVAISDDVHEIVNVDTKNQGNARYLTELFLSHVLGRNIVEDDDVSNLEIDEAYALLGDSVLPFQKLLLHLLDRNFQFDLSDSSVDRNSHNTGDDTESQEFEKDFKQTHLRKRKNKIEQSKAAAQQQRADQNRVKRAEEKRAELARQQAAMGLDKDVALKAINTEPPIVYLDQQIGAKVKPHQVDGIHFMWREIIGDPKRQGCLLAHTMGLGKTMQVISLLVTIAQSKTSPDPDIRALIPDHLKGNRVMILCPMALIENWEEEFTRWMPVNSKGQSPLGDITVLTNKIRDPPTTIEGWMTRGGVLILSYNRFRLYTKPPKATKVQRNNPDQTRKYLLEGADIVVADEAHYLKNSNSKVTQAANEIRTWSRIALTGSPLNNHLKEYHTMIDWIAPGYLGTALQFQAKYVEPIESGLYTESSTWERKSSLKRLHVLKKNIAPKINRADITAVARDLPPKTEFMITIPLTSDQEEAYRLYVAELLDPDGSGQLKKNNARVWSWLTVLSLLITHPSCFIEKLKQRGQQQQQQKTQTGNIENDDGYDSAATDHPAEDVNLQAEPELADAMQKVVDVFIEAKVLYRIEEPSLSYKSLLISYILEEAVKLGEKTIIFSHSIPTLNYYESMIKDMGLSYKRIDGQKRAGDRLTRQEHVERFNNDDHFKVMIVSTRAGGLGLNIQSATRVIINDFGWNPAWEEQAIGRAYRMGQKKPVYVYRFKAGGTYDELVHNKTIFKSQLFTRVVDEKNVMRAAQKSPGDYLFPPKPVPQQNFDECRGKDPHVLDRVLQRVDCVRNIVLTETFLADEEEELTEQEIKEADEELALEKLERDNPTEFARRMQAKQAEDAKKARELLHSGNPATSQNMQRSANGSSLQYQMAGQITGPQSHYFNGAFGISAGYSADSILHHPYPSYPAFAAVTSGAEFRPAFTTATSGAESLPAFATSGNVADVLESSTRSANTGGTLDAFPEANIAGGDDSAMFEDFFQYPPDDNNADNSAGSAAIVTPRRASLPENHASSSANLTAGSSSTLPSGGALAPSDVNNVDRADNTDETEDNEDSNASGCRSQ